MTQNLAEAKKPGRSRPARPARRSRSAPRARCRASRSRPPPTSRRAVAIGLKVTLKSVSAENYINFFTAASCAQGRRRASSTVNYGDYADPAALLATVALPGADQNYDNFNDPQITSLLDQARGTANPDAAGRAGRQGRAAGRAARCRGSRPSQPTNVLVLSSKPDRRDRLVRLHVRAVGRPPSAASRLMTQAKVPAPAARDAGLASLLVASFVIFGVAVPGPRQRARRR